jgi:thioredoxin reductase
MWDAIVVGGGPAGLSAALFLGRCRRKTLLFDDGRYRNERSSAAHGFFTRDGASPAELLRIGREQLLPYGVRIVESRVLGAARHAEGFELNTKAGVFMARKLLLATGLVDDLPAVEGLDELYGRSVFHCPVCDGWEVRDARIAVLGPPPAAVELSLALTTWASDVVLCTNGEGDPSEREALELQAHSIPVRTEPVVRLEADGSRLRSVVFAAGANLPRDALFISAGVKQRSSLHAQLAHSTQLQGRVRTAEDQSGAVPGLYVVGDASDDVSFIAIAVAEGARAACAANKALRLEESQARVARFLGQDTGRKAAS